MRGYGQAETWKPFLKPHVLAFREALIGEDPALVERIMLKIRQRDGFKPWRSAVSIIETALWDTAGKVAGPPTHKLLGGKVRDKVRGSTTARDGCRWHCNSVMMLMTGVNRLLKSRTIVACKTKASEEL